MTSITPKGKKIAYLHLAANTPGHPDQAEAKARLAKLAGVTREPVKATIAPVSLPTDSANLKRFDRDGIELVIDTQTGEAFYPSIKALARVCSIGLDKPIQATQVNRAIESALAESKNKGVTFSVPFEAEIQTPGGLQGVTLIPRQLGTKAIKKHNPSLFEEMAEAGHLVFLHQLAGFKVTSNAIAKSKTESTPPETQSEQSKLGSSVDATIDALNSLKRLLTTVPDALVDGFLLNQVQKYHPELKSTIDDAHTLLAANTPVPEILLTPTAIGERLGLTARAVNTLLTSGGYQVKNPSKSKTEPAYLPTEKGKQHSTNTLATGQGSDNTTYQHIKWKESIVDELRKLI